MWYLADTKVAHPTLPSDARVVVGLVKGILPFWERHFVQFINNGWHYMGSDQKCRDLKYWHDLTALPKE